MGEPALQLSLFTVSACDPPLRDNRDVMEYPFLSLQKKRLKPIEFSANNVRVSVAADVRYSIATIWDWDLIIFAASHLNDAIEDGREVSPRIQFVPYDALRQMGRSTGGKDYKELAQAIRRLRMTTIITNIRYDDEAGEERPFSWLSSYGLPKRYTRAGVMTPENPEGEPDPSRPWELELPPWLYNAILRRRDILAVHPGYFALTGGIERWLYRLARKAVPDKADFPGISFRMETMFDRSGLSGRLRKFRAKLEEIAEKQLLPEYDILINRDGPHELVTLIRNRTKPGRMPRGIAAPPPRIKKPKGPPREVLLAWVKARGALFAMPSKRVSNRELSSIFDDLKMLRIEGQTAILQAWNKEARDEIETLLGVDLADAFRLSSGGKITGVIIEAADAA